MDVQKIYVITKELLFEVKEDRVDVICGGE